MDSNPKKYPTLKIRDFSDSETLQDVKNKIMPMIHDRMNGHNLNACAVKNLSTGKLLRAETVCKGLFT